MVNIECEHATNKMLSSKGNVALELSMFASVKLILLKLSIVVILHQNGRIPYKLMGYFLLRQMKAAVLF